MLKNSLKYYWEDPEKITTVPLSTLDELLKVYPWSNVLRFLYWKRWLIEKTSSGNLEADSTDALPLYGELRYMLDNGPTKYGNQHFVSVQDTQSMIETETIQDEEDSSVSEEKSIISEDDNLEEEKEIHQIDEIQSPEIEAPLLPEELPAEAITDEIVQEFDAIESETVPFIEPQQSVDYEDSDEDISEDKEKLSSEFNAIPDHQTEDEDSIEESGEDLSDEQELIKEKVEVNIEDEIPIAPPVSPDMLIESPVEKEWVDENEFEKELKELEEAFLADYESVIQKLDEDIAKLNEQQQQEKYDEMLHEDNRTEIEDLIERSIIEKEEIKQVKINEPLIQIETSTPQESRKTEAGKFRPMRNLQFDEEVSGFTQWLLQLTNKQKNEEDSFDIEPQVEEVEESIPDEVQIDPSQYQENEDLEFPKEEEEEIDQDIWTSDEKPQEKIKAKKKKGKGKGKKKDKKKKKKKRKKGNKDPKEDIDIGIVSEPLAKLFAAQGAIDEAISMYEKLILYRPEKKSKFAARIKKLKQTQKN